MIHKLASFTVKPDKVRDATRTIAAFVDAIKRDEPGVASYESCQIAGTTAFRHTMTFRDAKAEQRHRTAAHTTAFVEALYPLCEEEPDFVDATLVRSTIR